MASISNSHGLFTIYLKDRRSAGPIRLGRVGRRTAETIRDHINALEVAKRTDTTAPGRTLTWLEAIADDLHLRLSNARLVSPRTRERLLLGTYFDGYIARRTDLKGSTRAALRQPRNAAIGYFGADRDMASVTLGDAEDFQRAMLEKLARATVAMYIKKLRQLWSDAMKRKLLTENPWKGVKAGSMANKSREVYVTRDDIDQVIDHVPDLEWKLLFALARYAGLRVPSEIRELRWADIHFDSGRMTVRSPKTEHHEGKDRRIIPIFPDVEAHLVNAFHAPDRDDVFVFKKLRGDNLATTGRKWIERAGITLWGKTWQNLRSSCETDLAGSFPIHVVCAWIGNSVSVAMRHYLQVTDDHFATARGAESGAGSRDVNRPKREHAATQPQVIPHLSSAERSLQDVNPPVNISLAQQKAHRALQFALHHAQGALAQLDRRLLRTLRTEIDAARRRSGGAR
jgi:integrase